MSLGQHLVENPETLSMLHALLAQRPTITCSGLQSDIELQSRILHHSPPCYCRIKARDILVDDLFDTWCQKKRGSIMKVQFWTHNCVSKFSLIVKSDMWRLVTTFPSHKILYNVAFCSTECQPNIVFTEWGKQTEKIEWEIVCDEREDNL